MSIFLKLLLLCLPLLVCAEEAPPPAKTPEQLQAQLSEARQQNASPAISYAIFDRDGVRLVGVEGVKQEGQAEAVSETTLFQIGSITKTVTAIAIMQLIEQGHFGLDTPVKQLLPSAPIVNPFEPQSSVSVRHLLSHSAGFDDMHFKAFFSRVEKRGGHLQQSMAQAEPLLSRWQPGLHHSYNNPSYVLLGAILEAHYRQDWDEIVTRQVLQPLGMRRSVALSSEALKVDHAVGHRGDDKTVVGLRFHQAQADGALWCSAAELAQLGRFMLSDGHSHRGVLSEESVRLMKQSQGLISQRAGLNWGYGLGVANRAVAHLPLQGHTGGVMGGSSSLMWLPDGSSGYVMLTNTDNGSRLLERPLVRYLYQAKMPDLKAVPLPTAASDGWFRVVNSRNEIFRLPEFLFNVLRLSKAADGLQLNAVVPGMGSATLLHHGNDHYADADSKNVVNNALLRDQTGAVQGFLSDTDYFERVSAFSAIAPVFSVLLALLLLLSAPFGRRHALRQRWLRRLPTVALSLLLLGLVAAFNFNLDVVTSINWQTITVLMVTSLLPLIALAGLFLSWRTWSQESARVAKWRCLLGSLAAVVLSAWFAAFHWFALATWAW